MIPLGLPGMLYTERLKFALLPFGVLACGAGDTAPIFCFSSGSRLQKELRGFGRAFLSSLRLHLFCVPHFTASCLCPFLLFTKRRKPQRGKEGKGLPCLKVFCALPDARPLIPAVPGARQRLWLFDAMRRDVEEDQTHGFHHLSAYIPEKQKGSLFREPLPVQELASNNPRSCTAHA